MLSDEYLGGVSDLLEDESCDLCAKTKPKIYVCSFDDGTDVKVCKTHFDMMLGLRKKARERRTGNTADRTADATNGPLSTSRL